MKAQDINSKCLKNEQKLGRSKKERFCEVLMTIAPLKKDRRKGQGTSENVLGTEEQQNVYKDKEYEMTCAKNIQRKSVKHGAVQKNITQENKGQSQEEWLNINLEQTSGSGIKYNFK